MGWRGCDGGSALQHLVVRVWCGAYGTGGDEDCGDDGEPKAAGAGLGGGGGGGGAQGLEPEDDGSGHTFAHELVARVILKPEGGALEDFEADGVDGSLDVIVGGGGGADVVAGVGGNDGGRERSGSNPVVITPSVVCLLFLIRLESV